MTSCITFFLLYLVNHDTSTLCGLVQKVQRGCEPKTLAVLGPRFAHLVSHAGTQRQSKYLLFYLSSSPLSCPLQGLQADTPAKWAISWSVGLWIVLCYYCTVPFLSRSLLRLWPFNDFSSEPTDRKGQWWKRAVILQPNNLPIPAILSRIKAMLWYKLKTHVLI